MITPSAPPSWTRYREAPDASLLLLVLVALLTAVVFVLAWDRAGYLPAVCALDFAVLTCAAFRHRLPAAHLIALPCLVFGCLTGFLLLRGNVSVPGLLSGPAGTVLLGLALGLGGVSELFFRARRPEHGVCYLTGAAVMAATSLLLVTFPARGVQGPQAAVLAYGSLGAAVLLLNTLRWGRPFVSSTGLALLLAATLWALWWLRPAQPALWGAVLAAEALAMVVLAAGLSPRRGQAVRAVCEPLLCSGVSTAWLALAAAGWSRWSAGTWSLSHALTGCLLSTFCLLLGAREQRPALVRWSGRLALGTAITAAGWTRAGWSELLQWPQPVAWATLWVSAAALTLALVGSGKTVFAVWRGVAIEAAVLALALSVVSLPLGSSVLPAYSAVVLAEAGLALCRASRPGSLAWTSVLAALALAWNLTAGDGRWLADQPFFGGLGWSLAAALALSSVGWGFWQLRRPGWAAVHGFTAGLVGALLLLVVRAWSSAHGPRLLTGGRWASSGVSLVQLVVTGLALVSVAQLGLRRWRRSGGTWLTPGRWLERHLTLAVAGTLLLLGGAVALLIRTAPSGAAAWTVEAGTFHGWLAFLTTALAVAWYFRQERRSVPAWAVGGLGVTAIELAACTLSREQPVWGYRWLLLGLAGCVPAWEFSSWRGGSRGDRTWTEAATAWGVGLGCITAALGLQAVCVHRELLTAAGALALVCPALAALAIRSRSPWWAATASAGLCALASLLTWHGLEGREIPSDEWWAPLVQANLIAVAAGSFFWMGTARRHQSDGPDYAFRASGRKGDSPLASGGLSPFLPDALSRVQAALSVLGLVGHLLVLAVPVALLTSAPGDRLPAGVLRVGGLAGWASFALALAAAWQTGGGTRRRDSLLAFGALGLGVLLACRVSRGDVGDWGAFHALTMAWAGAGLAALVYGWAREVSLARSRNRSQPARSLVLQSWVEGLAAVVVIFALRGTWEDPGRPFWPAGATLGSALLMAALACWSRWPRAVAIAGVLLNLAGGFCWLARGGSSLETFVAVQALCFALAAALWLLIPSLWRDRKARVALQGFAAPFTRLASTLSLVLFCGLVVLSAVRGWSGGVEETGGVLLRWALLPAFIILVKGLTVELTRLPAPPGVRKRP